MILKRPPELSIVIPSRTKDDRDLQRLLKALAAQTYQDFEVLVETRGNSEEAKGRAALAARGDIVGFFCTDNDIRDPRFLEVMVGYAKEPAVVGAYTERYDHVPSDAPLSRYFALLGANDPVCWWLGKADRADYLQIPRKSATAVTFQSGWIPSLGDNGFFIKREILLQANFTPETFGSCMCVCADLQRLGHATYTIVPGVALWHRTGEDAWDYLKRRWRYVRELYWKKLAMRRWVLVSSQRDWWRAVSFALASILVVPHLWVAWRGYQRVRDRAWFLHPVLCLALTCLYTAAWIEAVLTSAWSSVRGSGLTTYGGV